MNKFIALSFFVLTFLYTSISFSQNSISGKVKDLAGKSIENVVVAIEKSKLFSTTDSKGEFKIKNIANGNYKVTISHLGYKLITKTLTLDNKDITVSFTLEEDLINLNAIVVTGTFDPRTSLESSTSISVLDTKAIQKTYTQGTAGLLQNIPGTFTDASAGEIFTRVYTRGISASAEDDMGWYYVSLQEDGLPVSLVQHSYYSPDLFHRVDLTTQKVEAIRGGSSSITAMNAPGGIYNFISHGIHQELTGDVQVSTGLQGNNNFLNRIDATIGGALGNDWYFNAGGHYRKDDGARDTDFTFSKGGQFKFNVIKKYDKGSLKFYGKLLNDKTNRYTGVAATNWENPTAAFGQDFRNSSLLMPSFNAKIPDGRNLENTINFNPSQGVHAKDYAFGVDFSQDLGNNWSVRNNSKFSAKNANWQTSISNAFVSLSDPTAYFISGAQFPIGQVVFKDVQSGSELARVNNAGILGGQPFEYISGSLPYDAIMGTSAWYKENKANEWMNQLTIRKKLENHDINTGLSLGFSDTSHFTQGSFAFATYEPNPRILEVTLENPGDPVLALSDKNGASNYGGLFFVNSRANVSQIAPFINDRWKVSEKLYLDLGVRYESINHKGSKDRYAPFSQDGGVDGDATTAYDNGVLTPTGDQDNFNFTYNYVSYSGGINYKINENAALFSRYSKGNKAPELNYYFNNFANVPINQKGEVQKIIQTELGLKLNAKNASFTGTAFWSTLKDVGIANFEFDGDTNSTFYTPIQFNTSETFGFEWESVFTPIDYFSFRFNGVLQSPKAKDWKVYDAAGSVDTSDDTITDYSGKTLAFNPKVMFNLSAEFEKDKFSASLKWQYMGKRFGNVSNAFELAAYSVFDLGTGYQINKNLSANILVTNLFNSDGLANFFGANSFGANANGATSDFIAANPDASFVVFPILRRRAMLKINYHF
ncbi:TonB-dependent receptor [Polaribacter sp. Q13]|uniref:TonB-dependent receptor n=1 Tax=Polaribacter sp. Q13 TaxID=2806551 RepID=UPI00193C4D48|nr:TonB-dependent receptor [Polaribacter sp. Q13]QVY66024.1 TonB-dependent receptor [Polaribacter sp. Q13]